MIDLRNVKRSFLGNYKPTLNNVSLNIAQGDFCVIIGPNGCGKSTLLKMISGSYFPDSGSVAINDNVAQVAQDVNLGTMPQMTLFENIALSNITKPKFLFYRRYKSEVIDKLKKLKIGLEKHIDKPLKLLSGGQKQMVATLIAINSGCKILLLDEHTSALDPNMQKILMDYTANEISKLGLTSVMVTHKMDDAIKYGNRLIMLHEGRIVMDVRDGEKQKLQVKDLLAFFHKCEDQTLISGGEYDY